MIMDIQTLRLAIDTLNGRISRMGAIQDDWSHGVLAGLISARSDLEHMLETADLYRDSQENQ